MTKRSSRSDSIYAVALLFLCNSNILWECCHKKSVITSSRRNKLQFHLKSGIPIEELETMVVATYLKTQLTH